MVAASSPAQTNRPAGGVVAWGNNDYGQTSVPEGLNDVVSVAAGDYYSLALRSDGTVVGWGNNDYGQISVPEGLKNATAISAGLGGPTLALTTDGRVVAWGGWSAMLTNVPPGLSNAIAIAAGYSGGLAVKSNGTVVAWGATYGSTYVPAGLSNVIAIAAGAYHSLALRSDGTVVAWGEDSAGQTNVPAGLSNVIAVAGGFCHSLALKSDGTVVAWPSIWWNIPPTGLSNVTAIAAGTYYSLVLKSDGTVIAWGLYGATNVPTTLHGVAAITAGEDHGLAIVLSPNLSVSPVSQLVGAGSTVEFHASVAGAPPFTYEWFFNSTNGITEPTTNSDLIMTNVQVSQSGAYTVVITNAFGAVTSSPALLEVGADPPTISMDPSNLMVSLGGTALFKVVVTGTPPLTYQWFFNSINEISGATNPVLRLTDAQFSQAGAYSVVITNLFGAVTSSPAMLNVVEAWAVTNATEADLRAAMDRGGRVTFACDGAILLSSTIAIEQDTVLDGTGHQVTISGGDAVRVLYNTTNTSLTLINVTIANGRCTNGAGIFNDGGTLTLSNVLFETNNAYIQNSSSGGPEGGAIYNRAGTVNATDCNFYGNAAAPPPQYFGPWEARGGAIRNEGGFARLKNCVFAGNSACGGIIPASPEVSFAPGADGAGGAIYNDNGASLTASGCEFTGNSASGGPGPSSSSPYPNNGGSGTGGAVFNSGVMEADACTFSQNSGFGAAGTSNTWISWSGSGGSGKGGGIFNSGSLVVQSNAFWDNTVCGGSGGNAGPVFGTSRPVGGTGGSGSGGGICNLGSLSVQSSLFHGNGAAGEGGGRGGDGMPATVSSGADPGGTGGIGGSGYGGGLFNSGTASLVNSTIATNVGSGSTGGEGGTGGSSFNAPHHPDGANGGAGGGGGSGFGGVYVESGSVKITNCTIAYNLGEFGQGGAGGQGGSSDYYPGFPGTSGTNGIAAGGIVALGSLTVNTILASNSPSNCIGIITDAGHNLSSDNSCAFTNVGSLNNTDPMLGLLADNGGPTLTMALLPGSPAIDGGDDSAAPPTDQRGFPRLVGAASDIGAYECNPPNIAAFTPTQTVEAESSIELTVDTFGDPAVAYLWYFNGTNLVACSTNCWSELTNCQFCQSGTYTVVVSNTFGEVTSTPFMLNVIPAVERRSVPGLKMVGEAGGSLNVEHTESLSPATNWLPLDIVNLTNSPQFWFDLTKPLPTQRFYRAWQAGSPSVTPSLSLPGMVPAITLTGNIGNSLRLDCINQIGPTDAWMTLDTVTLTNTSQLYFDVSSIGQPPRLWRIVPVP